LHVDVYAMLVQPLADQTRGGLSFMLKKEGAAVIWAGIGHRSRPDHEGSGRSWPPVLVPSVVVIERNLRAERWASRD
jgi:hypothetical protein